MEWHRWQQQLCSGCGQPRSECFDAAGPAYEATVLRCRACEARDAKSKEFTEAGNPAGIYVSVVEAE